MHNGSRFPRWHPPKLAGIKREWGIGFANNKWHLRKGGITDAAVFVDRRFVASGKAKGFNEKIAFLQLASANAYEALRTGHRLDLRTPLGHLSFSLQGTAQAMTAVLRCANSLREPETTAAPGTRSALDFSIVSTAETAVLVTNLLNAAGVRGYRLDPPSATSGHVTYRLEDGRTGIVRAARGMHTKTADEYTGVVISHFSERCKGEFISAKKTVPSIDGSVVRQVLTTCKIGDLLSAIETTIIRRSNGFLIEFSQAASPALDATPDTRANKPHIAIVEAASSLSNLR